MINYIKSISKTVGLFDPIMFIMGKNIELWEVTKEAKEKKKQYENEMKAARTDQQRKEITEKYNQQFAKIIENDVTLRTAYEKEYAKKAVDVVDGVKNLTGNITGIIIAAIAGMLLILIIK